MIDEKKYILYLILFFCGIKYSVNGLENLDPNKNYIFAGNHTSALDIPLAFSGLPYWLVPIAKGELKPVFILGWVMDTAGHIWVDRRRSDLALKSLNNAVKPHISKINKTSLKKLQLAIHRLLPTVL